MLVFDISLGFVPATTNRRDIIHAVADKTKGSDALGWYSFEFGGSALKSYRPADL